MIPHPAPPAPAPSGTSPTALHETPVRFDCQGDTLIGVICAPDRGAPGVGVVIVVGGPQYRAGSHRQFTLLARALAARGIPSLRFDHRGLGDSTGTLRGFDHLGDDIQAAIDTLLAQHPELRSLALWGLCDAATALLDYAPRDPRVERLVLLNPWLDEAHVNARARLRYHYPERLFSSAFWKKLLRFKLNWTRSLREFVHLLRQVWSPSHRPAPGPSTTAGLLGNLAAFKGDCLVILSGCDHTAQKFMAATRSHPIMTTAKAQGRVTEHLLANANHTFSTQAWRQQVETWTAEWLLTPRRPVTSQDPESPPPAPSRP